MDTPLKKIGLWRTTSLVAGNMIASGIFMLPVSLAAYGSLSIVGWILSGFGAIVMALVYAWLSRQYVGANGGPYAYSREGLGSFAGFLVAWSYWISVWSTNAAISVGFVSYLGVFIPTVSASPVNSILTGLGAIWLLTWVNSRGVPAAGSVQLITTVMKMLPLLAVGGLGLLFIKLENFGPFNVSGTSDFEAIVATSTLTLFAFLGLESATIPGGSVENPDKTIPRATLLGTILVTIVYVIGTVAVMGILPHGQLRESGAPFADAAALIWGEQARYWVAAGAIVSTFGALNGWILMQGQIPAAAAADKLLPSFFARMNRFGAPGVSLVGSSILVTILLIMNFSGKLTDTYKLIILLSTMCALISYILSMASGMVIAAQRITEPKPRRKQITIAFIGFCFALLAIWGAGKDSVYYGLLFTLAGVPLFALQRIRMADEKRTTTEV